MLPFILHILLLHDVSPPPSVAWQANKHFHIYSGWFAYLAGLAQCYRGLTRVAGSDKLVFSAADINFSVSYLRTRPSTRGFMRVREFVGCPSRTRGLTSMQEQTKQTLVLEVA